jgi:hypothetical protein
MIGLGRVRQISGTIMPQAFMTNIPSLVILN